MAYTINYTPEDTYRYPRTKNKRNGKPSKFFMLLFILAAALYLKFHGIPDFLIPGDAETTKSTFQTMVTDLKNGESLDNAITTFCLEIISNAEQ